MRENKTATESSRNGKQRATIEASSKSVEQNLQNLA